MKLIPPVVINDSMLVSSNVPETDYAAWSAVTNYAAGVRCIRASTHSVYQRLVGGVTATPPESDSTNWTRVGPTNRWAMFDEATGTASTHASPLIVSIAPGMVDSLALLDVDARSVTVVMNSVDGEVYRRVVNLIDNSNVYDAYTYFFAPILMRRTVVLTDLPPYADGVISIEVEGEGGNVSVGTLVVGMVVELGETRYGVNLGGTDYSVKKTDAWGVTTVSERPEASRMTVPFVVDNAYLDQVMRVLKERRAKPSVWIGVKRFDSAIVYGYAINRQLLIPYEQVSECSVTIEGLI